MSVMFSVIMTLRVLLISY